MVIYVVQAAQKAKQEKIQKALEDLSIEVKKCQQSKDPNYMNSTLQALRFINI